MSGVMTLEVGTMPPIVLPLVLAGQAGDVFHQAVLGHSQWLYTFPGSGLPDLRRRLSRRVDSSNTHSVILVLITKLSPQFDLKLTSK